MDRLCDEDAALEAAGERGPSEPLSQLAAFVAAGEGPLGARRNAIAYMGGTAERGGDAVFSAVAAAFRREKAAGLRRTAGELTLSLSLTLSLTLTLALALALALTLTLTLTLILAPQATR